MKWLFIIVMLTAYGVAALVSPWVVVLLVGLTCRQCYHVLIESNEVEPTQ